MTPDLQQSFDLAVRHHRAGRLSEAESLYRQILSAAPHHADSLHLLGVLAGQSANVDAGIEMIRRAIAAKPGQATFHLNLGEIYRRIGKHDLGAAAYAEAARLRPSSEVAHYCLGLELFELRRLEEAVAAYQQAIRLKPDFADAYAHLAMAAMQLGRIDQALEAQQAVVRLRPGSADAWSNLGSMLAEAGRSGEAIDADRHAISLNPAHAEARSNLGGALGAQGQYEQALIECREALRLQPELAQAHNNLGTILLAMWRLEEACASFGKAIALRPDYAQAHNNLGIVLNHTGQQDQAIAAHQKAIALRPGYVQAHSNLVFALQFHPAYDAASIAAEHRRWVSQHVKPLQRRRLPSRNDPDPDRRLRVGYVSPDFCNHVVGRNLLPLFRQHDRDRFEVFCYANVLRPDETTRQFRAHCDRWQSIVGMHDERVAELVDTDQIDILVDLALHTAGNRLLVFARRPAPVQVTFAGYPGSTGLQAIDYRLTDPCLDPPGGQDEPFYSEQSVRLPDSFWCYDPAVMTDGNELGPQAGPLPALSRGQVTFGCLNNFCKVNDRVLALWARALGAVAGSRLMLLAPEGSARQHTLEVMTRKGIDPARVEFVANAPMDQYLQRYGQIDIGLDTFPYNGHTTSLDALWMGVPVVTLVGTTVVGRAGLSQLTNLNLTELIARSEEQYVRIATELAGDLPRLCDLRARLRQRMRESALTDVPRFARHIETAYRELWRRWCSNHVHNPGSPLKDAAQPEAALAANNRAMASRPPDPQAFRRIGLALQEAGRLDEAIAAYRQAVALGPADAQTLSNLGVALRGKGQLDEAVEVLRGAIALQGDSAEALGNLGNALGDRGQFDDAIAAYRRAIALRPNSAEVYSNMANALEANGQLDEAVAACGKAIALRPNLAEAHNILGNALHNLGRLDDAVAAYRRALVLKPAYPEAHFGLASSLLMRGDFPQGWEHYEWRWKCRDFPSPRRSMAGLQWDGGPLENRTLLLHAEQGFGDAIQFIRYLPWAARRGGKIIVECQAELQRLLGTVSEKCHIVPRGSALPDHDLHCPLASLPRIFRTDSRAIPAEVPYLRPEPRLLDSWRPKVMDPAAPAAGLKVALTWAGNPSFKYDRSRSMSLARLAALAQVSGVTFYSVQKGHAEPQARTPPPGLRLVNLAPELHDFADTAAVLSMMDLVITTDTSVAHLAGALGRPVWVMLQFVPDWRWLTEREDSPWYPTMRLFRQPARGDWAAVIKRVADELSSLAVGLRAGNPQ